MSAAGENRKRKKKEKEKRKKEGGADEKVLFLPLLFIRSARKSSFQKLKAKQHFHSLLSFSFLLVHFFFFESVRDDNAARYAQKDFLILHIIPVVAV